MSIKVRMALYAFSRSVRRYTPAIEKKINQSGKKPDPAVVFSVAKYYPTLNRLAKA